MLGFKKGNPIVRIDGGKYDKKIIKLDETIKSDDTAKVVDDTHESNTLNLKSKSCPHCDARFARSDCVKRHMAASCKVLLFKTFIKKGLIGNDDNEDIEEEDYEDEYEEYRKTNKKLQTTFDNFYIDDGKVIPLPNIKTRECLYIAGPQGSGKSYYTAMYIREFKKMFKKKKIILFSMVENDKAYENIKGIKQIKIDESLIDDPINIKEELTNSLCIFDDIDAIQNKKLQQAVFNLMDDIASTGRDQESLGNDIYLISTSHQITDYQNTRGILNNATSITIFPKSGSAYGIQRALKLYCGMSTKQIENVMKLPSRWVTLYKRYPQYVVYEKGIYIVK